MNALIVLTSKSTLILAQQIIIELLKKWLLHTYVYDNDIYDIYLLQVIVQNTVALGIWFSPISIQTVCCLQLSDVHSFIDQMKLTNVIECYMYLRNKHKVKNFTVIWTWLVTWSYFVKPVPTNFISRWIF